MNNPFELIEARLNNIETLLLDLKHNSKEQFPTTDQDELFTVQQAAKFLSLSIPTVYGLISKGDLPVMKRSKRCYFSKADLMEYLKAGRRQTNSETVQKAASYLNKPKR